jgi:hypothetical protein
MMHCSNFCVIIYNYNLKYFSFIQRLITCIIISYEEGHDISTILRWVGRGLKNKMVLNKKFAWKKKKIFFLV